MAGTALRKIWAIGVVAQDHRLSDKAKILFTRLVDRFRVPSGPAFPSHKRLAAEIGCTDRTVRNAINQLARAGYLTVQKKAGPGGTNFYWPWIPSGRKEHQEAEARCTNSRKPVAYKTSKENSKESKSLSRYLDRTQPRRTAIAKNAEDLDKRAALETHIVESLGGGRDAWLNLISLDESVFQDTLDKVIDDKLSVDEATRRIADACRRVSFEPSVKD